MATKKKKMGKVGPVAEKKVIPVETDPTRLVNYVCGSNYMQKGEDIKVDNKVIGSSGRCLIFPLSAQTRFGVSGLAVGLALGWP